MTIIIALLAAGFLLLLAEVLLPGLIAGICGAICLLIATILVFMQYGPDAGIYLLMGEIVFGLIGFVLWMKYFPETRFGRQFILPKATNDSPLPLQYFELLEKRGKALTSLRPGGTIEIDGLRHDAVSESQFIEAGEAIQVVKLDGQIIVVRKI